ncbi:uncharacterized protein LOC111041416 [Myzus persicae]|uniref:uncharacterized protein LOC111041416 n=1 Tax=Myzus persicae TaxID=13164 RepID=UPI000B93600C|nr:uncharacterized protein LOC111041416 [Myzus persicae]
MKSKVVIATICTIFITYSDAELKLTNQDFLGFSPLMDNTIDVCGFSAEISNYSVKGVSLDSKKIGGCAYTNYTKNGMEVKKSFNVWLSDLQSGKQQCGVEGMEQTIFSCLGKPIFLKSNNFGTQYARLNGRVINKNGTDSNRCALLEKEIGSYKKYRLVISGDNSCTGMSSYFTDTYPRIQKGYKLLRFFGEPKYQFRFKRSISNSTSTIKNENWFYMWMLG